MEEQTKVTGVILAGGLARRMGGQDKGLMLYRGRPLLAYALEAMQSVVDEVTISANRNLEQYRQFGFPVLTDANANFDGPLAGILAVMRYTQGRGIILSAPCDAPLVQAMHLQRLLDTLRQSGANCCAAYDGQRLHPVFMAVHTGLADSLQDFLLAGERKIGLWLERQNYIKADFSAMPEIFANLNTERDLEELERKGQNFRPEEHRA